MPQFKYRAKKGPKEIEEGVIEAASKAQAVSKLSQGGLYPVFLKKEELVSQDTRMQALSAFFGKIKPVETAVFTRQLADLLEAGLTLVNSLDVIHNQTASRKFKVIIADIRDYVKSGNGFAQALSRHPDVFSNLYVGMVRSGETGGTLEGVLNRLADFMEAQEEFKSKITAAMAYPVLMALVGIATAIVLITFVIPKIVGVFEDLGQALPLATSILLGMSEFLKGYWYLCIGGLAAIFFAVRQIRKTSNGRMVIDKLRLRIPVVGLLTKNADITRFANTLGTLLHSGVSILKAMDIVQDVLSNEAARSDIRNAYIGVREGATLAEALAKGSYFPFFVTNMIAVGEESGQLERSLLKIAQSYERQTDKAIKVISSLIEPCMILVMGLVVGFIVISILLPIFQISFMAE